MRSAYIPFYWAIVSAQRISLEWVKKAMEKSRPTFLGIGVTKAGTTWLWSQLNKHPDVWMTPAKEVHFFDRSTAYPTLNNLATSSFKRRLLGTKPWERRQVILGLAKIAFNVLRGRFREAVWWGTWTFGEYDTDWYVKLFSQARPDQVCGEITPGYAILEPEDISKIRDVNPDMRLIFMIRDPVERAWSGLRHNVAMGGDIDWNSLNEIMSRLKKPDVALRGDYERTIDNYMKYFDSSQILVCFYDAISHDPEGLMNSITSFLGIREFPKNTADLRARVLVSPERDMPEQVRSYLVEHYAPMMISASRRFGSYSSSWIKRYSNELEVGSGNDSLNFPTFNP
jgi:hypothetical protein